MRSQHHRNSTEWDLVNRKLFNDPSHYFVATAGRPVKRWPHMHDNENKLRLGCPPGEHYHYQCSTHHPNRYISWGEEDVLEHLRLAHGESVDSLGSWVRPEIAATVEH
jgi:hypothetical protein